VEDATERIQQILEAIAVLRHNPLIGRPVDIQEGASKTRESALRKLVIGRRALFPDDEQPQRLEVQFGVLLLTGRGSARG